MKKCVKCKIEKEVEDFCKDSKSKDGKQSQCKKCKAEYLKEYYANNPDKRGEKTKEQRLKTYYKNRVSMNFSRRLRKALNGLKEGHSWESLVGYSIIDLKEHLERQFIDGMGCHNYGEWHIDHKKPISSFNIESVDSKEFKECWSLDNLQPLWATTREINGVIYQGNTNKGDKH